MLSKTEGVIQIKIFEMEIQSGEQDLQKQSLLPLQISIRQGTLNAWSKQGESVT